MSKVHARFHEITNKLRVRTTKHRVYRLEKQTIMVRSVPQMLKKWRIVVNIISKVRQTTCPWIKKKLDETTRIVNVFLISWFFWLFLLCLISLLVKYDFILRCEAWVNAIRASSFFENFPQISAKPIAFQQNLLRKLSRNRPFFTNHFSAKLASKIPAKFPRNRPFFLRICPWKSREIWLFFHDLPEALIDSFCAQNQSFFYADNWVPCNEYLNKF